MMRCYILVQSEPLKVVVIGKQMVLLKLKLQVEMTVLGSETCVPCLPICLWQKVPFFEYHLKASRTFYCSVNTNEHVLKFCFSIC